MEEFSDVDSQHEASEEVSIAEPYSADEMALAKQDLEESIRSLSTKLVPLKPTSKKYKTIYKELKLAREKFDILFPPSVGVPKYREHQNDSNSNANSRESKMLASISSQIKFKISLTDPAEFLKKITMFFETENIKLTNDLYCRAILRVLLNNENTLAAHRFETNIMKNESINNNLHLIQNCFVKLFPHKSILVLEKEFWGLKFNMADYNDPSIAMQLFVNNFELLSINLCLNTNAAHSLSYLRALLPSWISNPIHQQELLKQNINQVDSLANNFDWQNLGSFQKFTNLVLETYSILLREKRVPTSNGKVITGNQLFCNYCKRTNHVEAFCRYKQKDKDSQNSEDNNRKKAKFSEPDVRSNDRRHRGFNHENKQ